MVFHWSYIPLYTKSTPSKLTPENSTISVGYLQSLLHGINEHISHEAEEKQKFNGIKNQTDMTSLNNEEISVINSVNKILAVDNILGSGRVRRSERSTHTGISTLILQYVSYFHNCSANHNQPLSKVGSTI
jgi:hypothetical protein